MAAGFAAIPSAAATPAAPAHRDGREMLRRPGETHRLALRRGDTRFEVTLTTRRMI